MAGPPFKYVLFDLGGVLVRLSGVRAMAGLAGIDREDELWRRWLACPWVRKLERGWCSVDEFGAGIVDEWQLPIRPQEFIEQFRRWPDGLFDGAEALVTSVRRQLPVGCLSNTNPLHWTDQRDVLGLGALFDAHFVSHEIGLVKPDREIFDHVVRTLDVRPEDLLFLDDNDVNVEGARAAGLVAARARGVAEARSALAAHDVLVEPAG